MYVCMYVCFVAVFYLSFVVTPLCSNASELLSSLVFASKRKIVNTSMTYSQVQTVSILRVRRVIIIVFYMLDCCCLNVAKIQHPSL